MARARKHKDVEFMVESARGEKYLDTFDEAAGLAISIAASSGEEVTIDVLISSRAGANWWGGDDAVEEYEDDPEASSSERIVVRADAQGKVP